MFLGPILTDVADLPTLDGHLTRMHADTLKVVTGWGCRQGWNDHTRAWVAQRVPNLIVRSVTGDPSHRDVNGALSSPYPDPNDLEREIAPWYAARPDIWIEVGNEPNVAPMHDSTAPWVWRYHMDACLTRCRLAFPKARLIAGGLLIGADDVPGRLLSIAKDVLAQYDAIGVHAYEHYSFTSNAYVRTKQWEKAYAWARQYVPSRPIWITEMGIHDPATLMSTKGWRYRGWLATLPPTVMGATLYHLCQQPIDADQRAYALDANAETVLGQWKR